MHPAALTHRFATSFATLCGLIARHGLARCLAGPLIVLIWGRVRGIGALIETLLARMQAGRLRRHPARHSPHPTAPRRRPAPRALPRKRAWLIGLIPETAASAAQLQTLLAHPDIPALLEAAPQLCRALRPLCHMLGVNLPRPSAAPDAAPDAAPAAAPPATASPGQHPRPTQSPRRGVRPRLLPPPPLATGPPITAA